MPKLWSLLEAKGKDMKNDHPDFLAELGYISVPAEEVNVGLLMRRQQSTILFLTNVCLCELAPRPPSHQMGET